MKLLLDTHALLWWLDDNPILAAGARSAIANPDAQVFVSAASAWEIAIKSTLGKLSAPDNLDEALIANNFLELPIRFLHASTAGRLPEYHRDPFDRMLIAQAQLEGLALVTRDRMFGQYGIETLGA